MWFKLSKEQRTDLLIILGWIVFVLCYFLPELIAQKNLPHSPFWHDEASHQWIPFWNFSAEMLKKGLVPLWSPHFFCGFPYFSYPPNNFYYLPFFFFYRFSYLTAVYLESILGYVLYGIFGYFALRRMRLSPVSSLAGMLAFLTGTYMAKYTTFSYAYRTWCYGMGYWALAGLIYQGPRLIYFWFLVLSYALGGTFNPEQVFYQGFFQLGWVLYSSPPSERLKRALILGLSAGIGLCLLAFAPIFNLITYGFNSVRASGVSFSFYREISWFWQWALGGFIPVQIPFYGLVFSILFWLECITPSRIWDKETW